MHLVLVGSKACGKSTVGRIVARSLGVPFEDTDGVLEAIHTERTGERKPFREIYRETGEAYFRELEEEAVRRCLRAGGRVVALGGGLPVRVPIGEALQRNFVVYLEASDDVLWARMSRDGLPVYLDPADPRADFERVLAERRPVYERIADLRLDADRGPEVIAAEIVSHWKARVREAKRRRTVG
ncbi:MAG: shikimate kinase [Nitrospinota bacterium]